MDNMNAKGAELGGLDAHAASWRYKKVLIILLGAVLALLGLYLLSLFRNSLRSYRYIGVADTFERTITIMGLGKVTADNDIAVTSIGYTNINKDVTVAQTENAKVMDKVLADLKRMGIEESDLTSSYSIYSEYNYLTNSKEFNGYRVNNSVRVKVRDLTKIGEVLALAGKHGANEVGGLSFTIDDPENLKNDARDQAIKDAQKKAEQLADSLGVRLKEITGYYELDPGQVFEARAMSLESLGTADKAPEIASGSQEVSVSVNITYLITPK